MMKGIKLNKVSFSYEPKKPVLRGISLEIKRGEFWGVCGVNGSGKSTLSLLLNGLIPHLVKGKLSGEVTVEGESTKEKGITHFARQVGIVFQNPDFSLFNLTVGEEIEFGLKNFGIRDTDSRIKASLRQVGLSDFIDRDPQTLSIGEKQKISLACVLALDTDYIVLDEPVAQLDYRSAVEFYRILESLNSRGKTIVVIEHDSDFVWRFTKKVIIIDSGRIVKNGKTAEVFSDTAFLNRLGLKVPTKAFL